jgi:hypothetical protein
MRMENLHIPQRPTLRIGQHQAFHGSESCSDPRPSLLKICEDSLEVLRESSPWPRRGYYRGRVVGVHCWPSSSSGARKTDTACILVGTVPLLPARSCRSLSERSSLPSHSTSRFNPSTCIAAPSSHLDRDSSACCQACKTVADASIVAVTFCEK